MKSEVAHNFRELTDYLKLLCPTELIQGHTFDSAVSGNEFCSGMCVWHWRLLMVLDSVSVQVHGTPPARRVVLAQELYTLSLGTVWPLYPLSCL